MLTPNIDPVKKGYQVNIFLISPQKPMLWLLIRSAYNIMVVYPQHMVLWTILKKYLQFFVEKYALSGAMPLESHAKIAIDDILKFSEQELSHDSIARLLTPCLPIVSH